MQRDAAVDARDPCRHFFGLLIRIVEPGYRKERELHVRGLVRCFYRLLHRLQAAFAYFFVKVRVHGFQVDVHGLDMRQKLLQRLRVYKAVCDKHRVLFIFPRGFIDVFIPYGRLVICESDADGFAQRIGNG